MHRSIRSLALLALLAGGCKGEVTAPQHDPQEGVVDADPSFACAEAAPPDVAMRRLTRDQLDNTLRDLLTERLGAARAEAILEAAGPQHSLLPVDEAPPRDNNRFKRDYRRWDQRVSELHVEGWYTTALALGEAMAADQDTLLEGCDTRDCAEAFLLDFAERAFRHPVPPATATRIGQVLGPTLTPTAFAESIAYVLLAPDFLYHVEEGAEAVGDETYALTDHELAARMSYALWDSLPDEELWRAANEGELSDETQLAAQVDRMLADPRSRPALGRFFEDWLQFMAAEDPSVLAGDTAYQAFAGEDLPSPELREAGLDEIRALVQRLVFDEGGTVEDLLTTDLAPVTDPELARLYGMDAPWDGEGEPPRFAEGERPGLLSRFTLLASATVATRPIHRGVFIREMILCDELPAPPDGASMATIELEGLHSNREYYEALTESPGTVCRGCHERWINPLGFVSERYDALGRRRDEERVFDLETGELLGTVPIDTSVSPSIFLRDESRVSDMAGLGAQLADSGKVEACLSRNLFRFVFARPEAVATDGCALEETRVAGVDGTLRDMVGAMVLSQEFQRRTIREGGE